MIYDRKEKKSNGFCLVDWLFGLRAHMQSDQITITVGCICFGFLVLYRGCGEKDAVNNSRCPGLSNLANGKGGGGWWDGFRGRIC